MKKKTKTNKYKKTHRSIDIKQKGIKTKHRSIFSTILKTKEYNTKTIR